MPPFECISIYDMRETFAFKYPARVSFRLLVYTPVGYLSSGFSFFVTRMFYEGGSPIVLSVSLFRNLLAKYNL